VQLRTYTPKNSKILVETSVLLAASVRVSFPEEGEVRDEFYYPAIELFAFLRKNLSDRLGITTQTVELEAQRTLSKAIMNTLERNIADKSKHLEYSSIAWNKCEENMRKLTNVLLREPCDEDSLGELGHEVYQMYKGLEARALNTEEEIIDWAHRGIEGMTSAGMRTAMFDIHILLVRQDNAQLVRLKKTHASPSDIKILAEAIQIKRRYDKALGDNLNMFLASTDSNNFSPAPTEWGPSNTVTETIRQRFGVVCDLPSEIQKKFTE
jgi:hypothetical protein